MPEIETKIDVNLILEEYGRFYENSGQGMDRLKRALMVPATTLEKYATRINTKDDIYKMTTEEWEDVLQPFRIQFEPKAGVKFIPNAIILNHIKVDAQFSPMGIYHSWMAFLAGGENKIENWPITRYFVEVYLKRKIDNNRELKAVYKGVRDDNGNTPESCMDGIKKKLIEGANDPNNPINVIHGVDAFTEENIFDEIEAYDRKIDELYDGENIIHFVAPKWVRAMKTAKRAAGYYFINSPDQINADIDFTKHVVCGVPSMKGTDDIFSTMKENLLWLTNRNKFDFDIQKENRMIKVLADWMEGVGFGCNAMVWTSARTVGQEGSVCGCGPNGEVESLTDEIEYILSAAAQGARIVKEGNMYRVTWLNNTPELALNVQTHEATDITTGSFTLHGRISGDDVAQLSNANIGFYIAESADQLVPRHGRHLGYEMPNYGESRPANEAFFLPATVSENRLTATMQENMPSETDIFYRAVVHFNGAEYLGDIERFTTPHNDNPPEGGITPQANVSVQTDSCSYVGDHTVELHADYSGLEYNQADRMGFYVSTSADNLVAGDDTELSENINTYGNGETLTDGDSYYYEASSIGNESFSAQVTGDSENQVSFYYRAFVIYNGREYLGEIRQASIS